MQYSVFECRVNEMQYETFQARLLKIINPKTDSIRFYRLRSPRAKYMESFGVDDYTDFDEPLII